MEEGTRQEEIKNKREYWRTHSEAWQESGQTQGEYCKQHGLNLKTFAYWRRRQKKDNPSVRLVQLSAEALHQAERSALRIVVDNRYAIEVSDGFNPTTLGRVVEVLRGL